MRNGAKIMTSLPLDPPFPLTEALSQFCLDDFLLLPLLEPADEGLPMDEGPF